MQPNGQPMPDPPESGEGGPDARRHLHPENKCLEAATMIALNYPQRRVDDTETK